MGTTLPRWPEGDIRADTPEAAFERAAPAERERLIAEHHDNREYWGRCQRCGHEIRGLLKLIRGAACPGCGFVGGR